MLTSLSIRNIALIDRISVAFDQGFHVLTGETGAGKSIVVDAISLLLGARADRQIIRAGEDKAFVEGLFELSDSPQAAAWLDENELRDNGDELILAREITQQGRSVCRVNGVTLPLAQYQTLTRLLIDLHGQHEHQQLLDDKRHLRFLDAFGDEAHQALARETAERFAAYREAKRAYEKARRASEEKAERVETLSAQKRELTDAALERGEEETLERERDLFRNVEKIDRQLRLAFEDVYDAADGAALTRLRQAATAMRQISALDDGFQAMADRLDAAYYELEDAGLTLRDMIAQNGADPDRQEYVAARLDLIRRLSRKYGATTEAMLAKLERISAELAAFEELDGTLDALARAAEICREEYAQTADALSASRRRLAKQFEAATERQLSDLNMAGTKFCVSLEPSGDTENGRETCAFLIAPNRGEDMQPLSKIASGGELSRLMLAIKSIAADNAGVPTMIFDEIDTGISGRTAQVVGEKLRAIAARKQVLCVTHLQQIAVMADRHFLVEKAFDGERTVTHITALSGEGRVAEIARMLGGDEESARKHATEMLNRSDRSVRDSAE